jgi:tetratricopeptide (TPR) repeat protein
VAIDWAVWGPPAAVLGIGAAAGYIMSQARLGSGDPAITAESRRLDLEATRDEVVEQLKQLEMDRDKLDPADYEREREALLARGSRALEALENPESSGARPAPRVHDRPGDPPQGGSGGTGTGAPVAGGGGLAPEWKGALYALGIVGLLFVLWQLAAGMSRDRGNGSMTGFDRGAGDGPDAPMQAPPPDPAALAREEQFRKDIAMLEAKIASEGETVQIRNDLTRLHMNVQDYGPAMQHNDAALKLDATNRDARAYRGLLRLTMGMPDQAMAQLDEVLAEEPNHVKASIFKSILTFQKGDPDAAVAMLEAALQAHPEEPELIEAAAQARAARDQVKAAGAGMGGAPPAAGGGDLIVSGTLQMDPAALATLSGRYTLFVSVSDPSRPGPPVAAEKIDMAQFPTPFELTTADIRAMPGASASVPDVMELKARIDLDGNAMTKEEGAPIAVVTGVKKGTAGIVVTLSLSGAPTAAAGGGLVAPLAGGPAEVLAEGVANVGAGVALTGSEWVFVSLKDPAGGPPLASVKVPAKFPLSFKVTSADIIQMAGPRNVPEAFNLSVRVDRDGNAMTKDGEPEAVVQGVKKGVQGLDLMLQ